MELAPAEVHVWHAALDVSAHVLEILRASLSAEELERAAHFYFPRDRDRFTAAHGIVREILGAYLKVSPVALGFVNNEYGKPALAGNLRDALRFNFSHSGQRVVIALARDREVGVDVEEYLPQRADPAVAEYYFSPTEVARLQALPAHLRPRAFFNCWTRKEAYIKALGMGLTIPLDSFDVSLAPGEPAALLRTSVAFDVGTWQLCHLELGEQYIGALAAPGLGWACELRQWTAPCLAPPS